MSRTKMLEPRDASAAISAAAEDGTHNHFHAPADHRQAASLDMWLFLATEVMMFSGLFCLYGVFRANNPDIFHYGQRYLDVGWGLINTVVLIVTVSAMVVAVFIASQRPTIIVIFNNDTPPTAAAPAVAPPTPTEASPVESATIAADESVEEEPTPCRSPERLAASLPYADAGEGQPAPPLHVGRRSARHMVGRCASSPPPTDSGINAGRPQPEPEMPHECGMAANSDAAGEIEVRVDGRPLPTPRDS